MALGYRLKGHESFYLREGWLTKGLRSVDTDPFVFSKNSGADALGVGTNMAKSIRYWMRTSALISESNKGGATLTETGRMIYSNDPYFEDVFSLWLVHINIVLNMPLATSWSVFFNRFELSSFKREEMIESMHMLLEELTGDEKLSERSIKDDCSAIISMYLNSKEVNVDPEDKKTSPFSALGLLKQNGNLLMKEQPSPKLIDPLLLLYIIREPLVENNSMSIDDIIDKPDMPGKILNINRVVCNELLDLLEQREYIIINRTAGLDMVYPQLMPSKEDIIAAHYHDERRIVAMHEPEVQYHI